MHTLHKKKHMHSCMPAYATVQKLLCHGSYGEFILCLARASCRLLFATRPAGVSTKLVAQRCSLKKTVQIHACSWRSRCCGVAQATFDHLCWCRHHPVCLWSHAQHAPELTDHRDFVSLFVCFWSKTRYLFPPFFSLALSMLEVIKARAIIIIQPVPGRMRLEMVIRIQNVILNGESWCLFSSEPYEKKSVTTIEDFVLYSNKHFESHLLGNGQGGTSFFLFFLRWGWVTQLWVFL